MMNHYEQIDRELDDLMLAMMPQQQPGWIICEVCGKPCGIVHDLEISTCCLGPVTVQGGGAQC